MSEYDSETQMNDYQQEQGKELFHYDTSLLRSVESINNWKQFIGTPVLDYLQKQEPFVLNEYDLISCGNQLRAVAFCRAIQKGLDELMKKYAKCYAQISSQNHDIVSTIAGLDQQLGKLVKYLHMVQSSKATDLYNELDSQGINNIYTNVRALVDYCVDLNTLWLTLLTPRMFREDLKEHLYKVNYGGTFLYYEKELLYLSERVKRAEINNFNLHPKSDAELLKNIGVIVNNTKLKPNLKTKIVSLLKGQHYAHKTNKSLKQQFIVSSLQMYNGEEVSEIWDYERYENLCIETLRKSLTHEEYRDCALYMQPENISFERRKRTLEFAEIYYALIYKLIHLKQKEPQMKQSNSQVAQVPHIDIPLKFIKFILQGQNIQLVGHLFVNFLISNKNAFSLNSPQLDKLLFGILDGMRQIYLSFGGLNWIVPTAALSALTNRFFYKFSEDIKDQIFNLLPMMVKHLGEDIMPTRPEFVQCQIEGNTHYKVQLKVISRSELLTAIFLYIRDAEYRDQDFYLDLPQVTPTNFETALMFMRSLQLKLRHHEPTEDQKKLWTMIIDEAVNQYKIRVNLKWYKPKKRVDVEQRQGQFLIHKQIKQKDAYELVQDTLNLRDQLMFDQLVDSANRGDVSFENQLIGYFKYCVDIEISASRLSSWIQDYELFSLLDRMRALLDINFGDIVTLTPDELVTLNQLHICLMFYNTKVQEAKGNQVYMLIVHKIVIPWIQSQDKENCQKFQERFSQFFLNYIIKDYYLVIGDSLITLLTNPHSNKENILLKLNFFMEDLQKQTVITNSIDNNAEFLQKIYSVLDSEMDISVMITIMLLILKFIEYQPSIEDQYVSLGFFVDFICEPARICEFLKKIQELGYHEQLKINYEIVKKLPDKFQDLSLNYICEILKAYIDSSTDKAQPQKLLQILDTVPQQKTKLVVVLLKAMIALRNKQRKLEALKSNPEALKQEEARTFKYWKDVENYVQINLAQRKKDEEQINLAKIAELFEESVFKKLKDDYKKILQTEHKKKSSLNKKSSMEKKLSESSSQNKQTQNKNKQIEKNIQIEDKQKQAKIWRKVVRNFGTFEDLILFGEDPVELLGSQEQLIYQKCLKIIQERSLQQKYLKRIIKKMPILQKCAEQTVKGILGESKENSKHIQPELLCKLIMITSRYRSKLVEQFILANISKIPIPFKVYQDYLVLDIHRKLEKLPKNMINRMLFEDLGADNMRKIDEIFDELIYMPFKKYQNIALKFDNKIEENQQGEEWQTQSDNGNEDDEESQTDLQKKKSDKKPKNDGENQQQQGNDIILDGESDEDSELDEDGLDDDEEDSIGDSNQDEEGGDQNNEKIVSMFYIENDQSLPKYKQLIKLREEINIAFEQNYLSMEGLEKKVKQDPELEKKLFRVVDILENEFTQKEIVIEILNKMPENLYKLVKNYGLTIQRNEQKVENYRKQVIKMQRFMNDYNMSDRDENSQQEDEDVDDDDEIYDDDDELSEQTNSIDDMFDGFDENHMFVVNQEGQIEQVKPEDIQKNEGQESDEQDIQQMKAVRQADESLSLPELRQINSKIQNELTGKELGQQEMVKILEISIIKLFSLHSYQLKQKPVMSFYSELIHSKQGKLFIDTLLTALRVDELYNQDQRLKLAKKLGHLELSIPKAMNNFLEIAVDIVTEDSKEGEKFTVTVRDDVGLLLPIGDEIMVKNNLPLQDNFLTILIFYSRYNQGNVHEKIKKLLSNLNSQDGKDQYKLTKSKAAILTRHIYNNSNSSSIWNNIQQRFAVKIDTKTKFKSCLTLYGQLLREDIEKCYNDLVEMVKVPIEVHNQDDKSRARQLIKQQEKKVEQNLRKHFKRIKHFYYWNKRNMVGQLDKNDDNKVMENKSLIKLTELMIFYCHLLKQRFFEKIDPSAMKNLLLLPKSLIETAFIFLWKLEVKIDKWQPLNKVKQYFKTFKLYEHKFTRLEEVCNLVLQFLEMPEFSNSKFKEVIIPYFIDNPQMAHQIPLIFKLPDIPEELNGQKMYLTRQCSFDMSFYQLVGKSILVEFHNEEGSDHGGMVREFMMGWSGVGVGQEHVFIGKLLAISFRKSIPYGGDFDIAMAVAITQHKVTIEFLSTVDPEVAQSLKYIRDSDPQDLQMKFQITKQVYGAVKHFPLKPGGEQISVTNQNKEQYLQLFLEKYFWVGRQWELSEICKGFFSIVNKRYAAIFSPLEMIQKIQGEQISDYMKLKDKTKYEEGYTESSQNIKWFWQIVSGFNQKQMNKFLQFITGAPKVSIYNHNFSFVIEKPYGDGENRLPVAHTCFNTLELPEYKTKEILEKKLTQAIYEGNDSFGIL